MAAGKGALAGVILAMLFTFGCGGGSNSMTTGGGMGTSSSTSAQVRVGDAPADRVVSFEVTVGPITLMPTSGSAVTVLSNSHTIELTHLAGTSEPLALLNVPQGSFSSMTLTAANPEISFVNTSGTVVKLEPPLNQMITVTFNPPLNVGASASVVNIDLNVANSITTDAQGNVTGVNLSASSFTVSTSAVAAENEQESDDGELEDTVGMVSSVSGNSFTIMMGQSGVSLTFTTDANTQFDDGASLATLMNSIVKVEGVTRSDGTLYAKEVEGEENQNGAEAEGVITQVTGNPATQLKIVAQDGIGAGMDNSMIGNTITVDVSNAGYKVSKGSIDTSGIGGLPAAPNFPFDATTIHAGQRVEVEAVSQMISGSFSAEKVKLKQQALSGTVSGLMGMGAPTTFTLTVPADSAFAMLSGSNNVTVFWQPGTDVQQLPAGLSNGASVRVRGLVFFNGSGFNMIARRITP
jgi:hypothetical protein